MIETIKSIWWEFKSHFVTEKVEFKIEGYCNKCGECCRNVYSLGTKTKLDFKIMQFFYPSYRMFFIKGKDSKGNLIFECKNINKDGTCAIYEKRPKICRDYPKKKITFYAQMPEKCGYKVIKKDFKKYLK